MAIEVKCHCGRLVYADDTLAGQHVQCPHCRGSVPVPVAMAAPAPPSPPARSAGQNEAMGVVVGGVVILTLLLVFSDTLKGGYFKWVAGGIVVGILGALGTLFGGKSDRSP